MIHDFAKVPRIYEMAPNARPEPVNVPRWLPKGRWLLLLITITGLMIWKASGRENVAESEFTPGHIESSEYQVALDQQAQEKAIEAQRQAAENQAAVAEQKRLVAELQERINSAPILEPQFGFYDSLAGSAWTVPVQRGVYVTEEDRKRAAQRYMLQAASVRDATEAQRVVQRLRQLGLQAFYSYDETSGWHRINVGPFDNVSKMNKAQDVLVSMRMMPLKRRI